MKKKLLSLVLTTALAVTALAGCGSTKIEESADKNSTQADNAQESTDTEKRVVKLGLTGVIYEDIWNPIKEQLAEEGVDLQYVQFSDFSLPNAALD